MKKIFSVALALVLVSLLSLSAFAAGSVVAPIEKEYDGGSVTITTNTTTGAITFEATTKDNFNFVGWEIEGDYEIIAGSLDSTSITVIFKDGTTAEDAVATPVFEKSGSGEEPTTTGNGEEPTTTGNGKDDKDPSGEKDSPKTGDSMAVLALATVALAGLVVSKKKLSK